MNSPRRDLLEIYQAALAAVDGAVRTRDAVTALPLHKHWSIIAIGKASDAMAVGAQEGLAERYRRGLVITKPGHMRYPHRLDQRTQVVMGDHPVPGLASIAAGQQLQTFISATAPDEALLFLISGGASSLVEILPDGMDLEDLAQVNRWLLASGLDIAVMNQIRKRCSAIKGGRLWHHLGERQVSVLYISDVPGDDPAVIGSGLLFPTTPNNPAGDVMPAGIAELLDRCVEVEPPLPCPKPEFAACVADQQQAREAALEKAQSLGYSARIVDEIITGDAAEVGMRLAKELIHAPSQVTIWGGETTVRLPEKPGQGGRCQHLALAATQVLEGCERVYFLAAGTDGSDGPGEDAGALIDGQSVYRGESQCFDIGECLQRADSGRFLEASGDLIQSGATGSNVMDLMIGLNLSVGEQTP